MHRLRSKNGQLLLPILAALFLFGLFWVAYVLWCRHVYWRMRMDMAADATALSAMRDEAATLNDIATTQIGENLLLQKIRIAGEDVAAVQIANANAFNEYLLGTSLLVHQFSPHALGMAIIVAKANGANQIPRAVPVPEHHLKGIALNVNFLHGIYPVYRQHYQAAYYARDWWPKKKSPQPIHRETWIVCHDHICEKGKARLWLDVDPNDALSNGGFPSEQTSFLGGLGVQSQYPQFNARLLPKN